MANRIQIRHGTNAPVDGELLPNELGWGNNALYIGGLNNNQNVVLPINITGNAATATNTTNDGDGNNISASYIKKQTIRSGSVSISSVAGSTTKTESIQFSPAFTNVPVVIATLNTSHTVTGYVTDCNVSVYNITVSGCEIRINNGYTSSRDLGAQWIAYGT